MRREEEMVSAGDIVFPMHFCRVVDGGGRGTCVCVMPNNKHQAEDMLLLLLLQGDERAQRTKSVSA